MSRKGEEMACEVAVLVIHGMGNQPADFAAATEARLRQEVERSGADSARLCFQSVHWAPVIARGEDELWTRLELGQLRWGDLRRFVVHALGDAIAYRRTEQGAPREIYAEVHRLIHKSLQELRHSLRDADGPLVVIAHSLGSHMMSNFIWDAQHDRGYPEGPAFEDWSDFERMRTLTSFITFGCNIPLFTLAYLQKGDVTAIQFPPDSLDPSLKSVARWLNFYDSDDALGYPLKHLSDSYQDAVTEDIKINAGGLFGFWNPLSHTGYWSDADFIRPVAHVLVDVLKAA